MSMDNDLQIEPPSTEAAGGDRRVRKLKRQEDDVCDRCGEDHPKCTAHRKRKDPSLPWEPCMQNPVPTSRTRKCRMHGGSTPTGMASPHYVHGDRRRDGKVGKLKRLNEEHYRHAIQVNSDAVKNLEESIVICGAIEMMWIEKLGTGLTVEAWEEIRAEIKRYRKIQKRHATEPPADEAEKGRRGRELDGQFDRIEQIALSKNDESKVHDRIYRAQEQARRLTETAAKVRKDVMRVVSVEDMNFILAVLLRAVQANVYDRAVLAKIQDYIQTELGPLIERLEG